MLRFTQVAPLENSPLVQDGKEAWFNILTLINLNPKLITVSNSTIAQLTLGLRVSAVHTARHINGATGKYSGSQIKNPSLVLMKSMMKTTWMPP